VDDLDQSDLDEDAPILEILPTEYVCPACWLIHLRAAGSSACDAV
jgi:hypothetical protein